ncbi:protein of unknown function [Burkholderia multivorans]
MHGMRRLAGKSSPHATMPVGASARHARASAPCGKLPASFHYPCAADWRAGFPQRPRSGDKSSYLANVSGPAIKVGRDRAENAPVVTIILGVACEVGSLFFRATCRDRLRAIAGELHRAK